MDPPLIEVENQRNVSLLKLLQTMKRLEDDPSNWFQTDVIDLESFSPMYQNVVFIDQNYSNSYVLESVKDTEVPTHALPRYVQYIGNSFSNVLILLIDRHSACGGWTIILKGLFIDPKMLLFVNTQSEFRQVKPKIEIIGLNDVRILFKPVCQNMRFSLCG